MLRLHVLGSGSKGNAAIVEDVATGEGIAIDCGLCKRDFLAGCSAASFDPAMLRGMFVTHDHTDHTKGLGVVLRGLAKAGVSGLPLYASPRVRAASRDIRDIEDLADLRPMAAGETVALPSAGQGAGLRVTAFRTSHDAAESFGFRIESADGDRLGFMTDTGTVAGEAHEALAGCRILAIESNHDLRMLDAAPYPWSVKKRIASDSGHLSNDQAARELGLLLHDGLEQVVAMHISENSNDYDLPVRSLLRAVQDAGHGASVRAAFQHRPVSAG